MRNVDLEKDGKRKVGGNENKSGNTILSVVKGNSTMKTTIRNESEMFDLYLQTTNL